MLLGECSHLDARACFEADYERAAGWPAFQAEQASRWGTQDVHPMVRLPVQLVTGPWDQESRRRLFWLTRGGVRLGSHDANLASWEVKLQCLDNAVVFAEEPDALVINCLVSRWALTGLPEDVVRKRLVHLDRRIEWGGDPPAVKDVLRRTADALNADAQFDRSNHVAAACGRF